MAPRPDTVVALTTTEGPHDVVADAARLALDEAARLYASELARWRQVRGWSQARLARATFYDRTYVSHIEGCRQAPTEAFTRSAEGALAAGGALWERWEAWRDARWVDAPASTAQAPQAQQSLAEQLRALSVEVAQLNQTMASLLAAQGATGADRALQVERSVR